MRDIRFIAEHRGGLLTKRHHQELMIWACGCAGHVLPLTGATTDDRLINALIVARDWADGNTTAGEAMKASASAHAVAREFTDPVSVAVARAVGHAAATAHMADHSLGASLYALKAVRNAGGSAVEEKKHQNDNLPPEIRDMVLTSRLEKERQFRL